MIDTRIKISSIIESQLPEFVREEFPLVIEFLSQYYLSLESQGGTADILQNIDQYIKIDNLTNLTEDTTLTSDISFFDSILNVDSTYGFPDSYGLLLIDDEIITYTSKTLKTFEGCIRGFSGTTSYQSKINPDQLVFKESNTAEHISQSIVQNLSILFLKEFFNKVKKQITPGFENRNFYSGLNKSLFVKQSKDFYSTKGTSTSFEILFRALYGQDVEVVRPRDFLFQPSDAQYIISKNLVVEAISGNPLDLENVTLYQDSTDFFDKARGTIIHVEKISRGNKNYYSIELDYNSSEENNIGNFSIHPKTKITTASIVGSNILDVDSTIGFPNKGTLIAILPNGSTLSIGYSSKNISQFYNCTNISQSIELEQELALDAYAYGYVGIDTSNIVKVRVTGVLSDLEIPKDNHYYSKGDKIKIQTLGKYLTDYKSNNWFFNISTKFEVLNIITLNFNNNIYQVDLYDDHLFTLGDSISLISPLGTELNANITFINSKKSFIIKSQGILNTSLSYTVRKNILKANSTNYSTINKYSANIQNTYIDTYNSLYVASSSIPAYLNQELKINDRSATITKKPFNNNQLSTDYPHGFYTGDSVVYTGDIITHGIYFVQKIDETTIKIARSRTNIDTNNFVSFNGTINFGKFVFTDFCYENLDTQLLESQKLIRKLNIPQDDGNKYETLPGLTGIFINGVEILNYKSKDNIYYGPIEKVIPTDPGFGYDVINPPLLIINDEVGTGASVYCSVTGKLERVDIIDPGFDYLEDPIISITGGNGNNASAKANLIFFDHLVIFNSQSNAGIANTSNYTFKFNEYHKFRNFEEVIYVTNEQKAIVGLTTNSTYFVSVQNEYIIKLHKSFTDAVSGIGTIQFTDYGLGNHEFKAKNKKKKIGSIIIQNSGSLYQNKKTTVTNIGINTSSDIINIISHGYNSGEIISYIPSTNPIGGLTTSLYYITTLTENEFKLSEIASGETPKDFYYKTKQYIKLTSTGSGTQIFNYPPINVSISGKIGISTIGTQDTTLYQASLQPIFRGKITSVFVENGGTSYGSEIINYNKQSEFLINSGSGASVKPIILNGKIVEVLINSPGSSYNSIPTLIIDGDGSGAILTPILSNGTLISVSIISGGMGYSQSNTYINVLRAGEGANFESQTKSWKIDLVERLIKTNKITDDDGILDNGINNSLGLQYTHAYAPRSLRKSVLALKLEKGILKYVQDLLLSPIDDVEINSESHSPIMGWAYDGNPIYGPYGYDLITGGTVRLMKSGYEPISNKNRPPSYSVGFFVEDYKYQNTGDLDEFNGRFCITPEYPNGIYAYFCTVNDIKEEPFVKYKKPSFPYIIGNYFKSKPIEFNFLNTSNQDDLNFKELKLLRNTTPYNLINKKSGYNYILNSNKIHTQLSEIQQISTGNIDSIEITSGGNNYQVGDSIIFDNTDTNGRNLNAKVSLLKGKEISQISVASSTVSDIEFTPIHDSRNFIGFSTLPHNFLNNDIVTITTEYENKKSTNIVVYSNILSLTAGIGSTSYTGIVTYFNVSGSLEYPNIKENDVYQIENEQVKVLNIDTLNSRIRVLRNYNGTSGLTTYFAGISLTEKTRKFQANFGISTSYQYNLNTQFYFDPKESVGLGTTAGVGINSTLNFSNSGAGITAITIPTQTIYLPNHQLKTGDSLVYNNNDGISISISTDGKSSYQLNNNSIVYAAKISNDLIGISTFKVGLGSTGIFIGIGTNKTGVLYFTGIGNGVYHSLTTQYTNTLVGQINKNVVIVSTASSHGLFVNDSVIIDVKSGITTTIIVKYNNYNKRLVLNPKSFISDNINIINNTITLEDHGYHQGQKVIHTSSSPSGGLVNEGIYYVVVFDSNRIKLSNTFYSTTTSIPDIIDIISASFGTISLINPPLSLFKNQTVKFDVSDSSLAFINDSAFDFNFYTDSNFKNKFESSSLTSSFEVAKFGLIGIDINARVILKITDNIPKNLYYKLDSKDLSKKEIVIDKEQLNNNQLNVIESGYNGSYNIVAISTNGFNYNILNKPEKNSYSFLEGDVKYYTNSPYAYGSIYSIGIKSKGNGFIILPKIVSIETQKGTDAILSLKSNTIGSVVKKQILDIGFDYSVDYTVRPTAKLPTILKVNPFYSFDSIEVIFVGKNYNISPNLVVLDTFTNKIIDDVILKYELGKLKVEILQNTKGLYNISPKLIPINNSNGVGISSISYNSSTKNVTISLNVGFSTASAYPFVVGDKVLIENVSVGKGSIGKGYNSSNYNYALFTLISLDPNIGGSQGTVVYNMSDYLSNDEVPGTYDLNNQTGRIIPEKYFPIFNSILKENSFYIGETLVSESSSGILQSLYKNNGYLKILTLDQFYIGNTIKGSTSGTIARIEESTSYDCVYNVESSSIVKNGWKKETGFLSNNLQRIHDNEYYQYFSYALKSQIPYDTWKNPVNNLNHTAGFKKFSDLIIESNPIEFSGISTFQNNGDFVGINDLSAFVDLNCVNDFDLAKEISIDIDGNIKSQEIIFNSKIIQDNIESIGNRVLIIDDVSNDFNSDPRLTPYSIVDSFRLKDVRSKKYILYVSDSNFIAERQVSLVTLLHNTFYGFLNQYAVTPNVYEMGSFDFSVTGDVGNLLFYPTKNEYNNFDVGYVSYDFQDALSGIGTINIGDIAYIGSNGISLSSGTSTATTIVGIASTYRSSKILVQIGATDSSYYQYNEFTVIHDGTNVNMLEYGQLSTGTLDALPSVGLGTYNAYLSGSNLNIDFTPNSSLIVGYTINSINLSISNTSVGVGTTFFDNSSITSNYSSIAASSPPIKTSISSYNNTDYNCAYYMVSIENTANNSYQVSEVLVLDDKNNTGIGSTNVYILEFGIIETNSSLGTLSVDVSATNTILYFTPISGIDVEVRVFQHSLGNSNIDITTTSIDF